MKSVIGKAEAEQFHNMDIVHYFYVGAINNALMATGFVLVNRGGSAKWRLWSGRDTDFLIDNPGDHVRNVDFAKAHF